MTLYQAPDAILDARFAGIRHGRPSFSLRHRALRLIWRMVWIIFAAWTPPPLHPWRRFLLVCFGAQIGATARIYGSATIWYPPNLAVGANAVIGPKVNCYSIAPIKVGHDAVVSQGAHLCTGSHNIHDPNFQLVAASIVVAPYAWIAAEAFVGPGTTVGEGAVLGARAVTVKNLDPWSVYVGNPARMTSQRHPGGLK